MKFNFGKEQIHSSKRMRKSPYLAKFVNKVFGYTNIGNYARFMIFKRLYQQLNLSDNAKILDLGCGYGEYSFALARKLNNSSVHALDIDKQRIDCLKLVINAENVNNIKPINTYLGKLPQKDFDFIFSIDVFEHILENEMPFKEVYNKLKPGGLFLVKIPNIYQKTLLPESWFIKHQEWLEDEHIGQVYDLEGLKERVLSEGFNIVNSEYTDGTLSRLAWEISYLAKEISILLHLASMPFSKFLIQIDHFFTKKHEGNAIHVIAQKPLM